MWEQIGHVSPRAKQKDAIADPQSRGKPLELTPNRALANNDEVSVRMVLGDHVERPNQRHLVLERIQSSNVADE